MFKIKRRFLTLIELLIASALTMLILTTLMYFYRDVSALSIEHEKAQKEAFQKAYVEAKLGLVLSKSVSPNDPKRDYAFYTGSDANGLLMGGSLSLIFTFDNGVMFDKEFSNHVLGRLFVDKNGRLILATWPSFKRWQSQSPAIKKEILMENVESIAFEFFVPPEKKGRPEAKNASSIEPKGAWHKEWKLDYKKLPPLMKLSVLQKEKKEPIIFSFFIDNSDMTILYDR